MSLFKNLKKKQIQKIILIIFCIICLKLISLIKDTQQKQIKLLKNVFVNFYLFIKGMLIFYGIRK